MEVNWYMHPLEWKVNPRLQRGCQILLYMKTGQKNRKYEMRKNNAGFSLVELMVVVAIMAVLMGVASYSFRLILSNSAKECAEKLSSQLYETKTGSMIRYGEELTIYYHQKAGSTDEYSDGYYIKRASYTISKAGLSGLSPTPKPIAGNEVRKIASNRVTISAFLKGDASPIPITNAQEITIRYDRISGAFKQAIINGVENSSYFEKIVITSGNKICTITMIPETGKHIVE